jgi:hypothetical protein
MRHFAMPTILAASLATSACGQAREEEGAGPMISRNYQVGAFDQVEAAGPFDVTIRTGAAPSVKAHGNEKLLDRVTVEVSGGKLLIRPKHEGLFGDWHRTHGKADIAITVPTLRSATLAGAGSIDIDKVRGDRFEGQIAGAGDFRIGSVEVGSFKMGISGAGDARAESGRAREADYSITGSGDLDAHAVASESIDVSIAGAGNVKAHATRTADISIVGSGDVEVTGGAKCSVSKVGSGDAHCS